jgi:hypothetical protein
MIETNLRTSSEKLWPPPVNSFWRALQILGEMRGEELFDRRASLRRFEIRRGDHLADLADGRMLVRSSNSVR